jgi:NitT/TauT family transport system substrate-binding protein
VPEPWATRLVQEGGGKVLVDEKTLWPGGRFVTANLVVSTQFLNEHPDPVKALITFIDGNSAEAQTVVNNAIKNISGTALPDAVISASFRNMDFTLDPIATSLQTSAEHAKDVDLLDSTDLTGIHDLTALNAVLTSQGQPEVQGL